MITIRPEQLEALKLQHTRDFAPAIAEMLRRLYPARVERWAADALLVFAVGAAERAIRHGAESERELLQYARLMFLIGVKDCRAGEPPWVTEILDAPSAAPQAKLDRLQQRIARAARAAAR